MDYTIYNEFLEVTVSDRGAELMSIKSRENGTEYLWQGDPAYWAGRAYNLFPICGRLTEGKYTYLGKTYEMNLHGFVRKSVLDATVLACDKIDFGIRADEKTLAMYPFEFEYHITYSLEGRSIRTEISVTNKSEATMPFALGGHPGFNVPLDAKGGFEDWELEFTPECSPRALRLSDTCYMLDGTDPFPLKEDRVLPLRHSLFDRDAVLLEGMSGKVTLRSDKSDRFVTVEFPDAMKYLSIWHTPKTDAPFVAIEPWTSVPARDGVIDDLEDKRDMFMLRPLATYELIWTITVG